jgi:RHS repeat-associated protein
VVCIFDSDGNEVYNFAQDAFGNELQIGAFGGDDWEDAAEDGITEHQTGKWMDPFTGLYYFQARWCDSDVGRFLSKDPAGIALNSYSFVAGVPTALVDLNGLYNVEAYEIEWSWKGRRKVPRPDVEKLVATWLDGLTKAPLKNGADDGFPCCNAGGKYTMYKAVLRKETVCERDVQKFMQDWVKSGKITIEPRWVGAGSSLGRGISLDIVSYNQNLLIHELLHEFQGSVFQGGHAYDFDVLVRCITAKMMYQTYKN